MIIQTKTFQENVTKEMHPRECIQGSVSRILRPTAPDITDIRILRLQRFSNA